MATRLAPPMATLRELVWGYFGPVIPELDEGMVTSAIEGAAISRSRTPLTFHAAIVAWFQNNRPWQRRWQNCEGEAM